MKAKAHITPTQIEQYCLGRLPADEHNAIERLAAGNPSVAHEIDRFMEQLEQTLADQAALPAALKAKTLNVLQNLAAEESGRLSEQPVLNKFSDAANWLRLVQPLLPQRLETSMYVHEFRNDDQVMQMLVWTNADYPDEVHEDVRESFMVLQGRCQCFIDGEPVELGPGGFLEIPLYKHHDVQVLEAPVLAVVQRIKVA